MSKGLTVNPDQRLIFISLLPCFAMLSVSQQKELATLMTEVHYSVGEKIVEENTLVDSVFIIATGLVEVSHLIKKKPHKIKFSKTLSPIRKVPVAILHTGETIGLNATGFFSVTGERTATVIALSPATLLQIDLKKLHNFLASYPELQAKMYAASEQMLRTQFIKQCLPFNRLSQARLIWLANRVEEVTLPAGKILFHEGEKGDRCYLIRRGQVEILTHHEDGSEHQLAILKAPTLFGEATLMTQASRNATARAVNECDLLELKHEYLSELIESENNVANTLMTLMVDRSRPLQNPHVTSHQRVTADEQTVVILKNPDNGNYFKLSEEGWFIWQLMDGRHTMQEITMQLSDEYNVFAPDVVAGLISKLAHAEFVTEVTVDNEKMLLKQPLWLRSVLKTRRLLEARIAFGDADPWLTQFYQKIAFILFYPLTKLLLALIIVAGFFAFGFATSHVITIFQTLRESWMLILLLIPFTLLSVALHELGHALATKSYGREVHYMGIGWYWLTPIAFTDTSDMWLSSQRSARVFVNLAGIYTDILVGGISALGIYLVPNAYIQAFLWLFSLFTYVSAFRMLNPLQELDGYYVLVDIFDRPRLRQASVVWLVKDCVKTLRSPILCRQYLPEITYWLACILFMILISIVTLLVQTFVFKIFGFKPNNIFISLALPFLAGLVSCLGILADIRKS